MDKKYIFFLFLLLYHFVPAQGVRKITGPLNVYHIAAGYSYSDTLGIDSVPMELEIPFGELEIPNQLIDNGFDFKSQLDSCSSWHPNKVFGIIQPPTEQGVYNQPSDTALLSPYPIGNGPGMVQGGQRFSKLSKIYSGLSGVVLDDWNGDTSITRQVRDAVQGKPVDENGIVHSECAATTPYNQLFVALYNTAAVPAVLPVCDGLFYSYYQGQNCCFTNLDADIDALRVNFRHKEIITAIFIYNSFLHWTDPVGVQYMLEHSLNRYDDGDINGVCLFAGPFFIKGKITLSRWNALALPYWLDSLYYPYLGVGTGKIIDCNTGNPLSAAFIRVYCKGRLSGDTLMRSRQKTDASGSFQFGLWAGNRNTDSTYYWLIAEKEGYIPDTIGFWMKRNDTTAIASFKLCPVMYDPKNDFVLYPNPSAGRLAFRLANNQAVIGLLEIYDMMGRSVYSTYYQNPSQACIDLSNLVDGVYVVVFKTENPKVIHRSTLLLKH